MMHEPYTIIDPSDSTRIYLSVGAAGLGAGMTSLRAGATSLCAGVTSNANRSAGILFPG